MSDLIERLRRRANSQLVAAHRENDKLHREAADEIERLRGLIKQVIDGKWCVTDLQESIGYLRADDEAETK